jgi:hypothetical protein
VREDGRRRGSGRVGDPLVPSYLRSHSRCSEAIGPRLPSPNKADVHTTFVRASASPSPVKIPRYLERSANYDIHTFNIQT